ncbi:sulfurtransferase [Phycisphaerae bacterium]|jgi:thiosulfate/3-mercaptopyruvate sulfurtransferase|nr:sulfurtransferase [Phycisphaerae bacterium]
MSYAFPDALVSTNWVKENLKSPAVRIVEVDVDTKQYGAGHVPGAVAFNWNTQLQDQINRDIISKDDFEKLLSSAGIKPTDTIVLYGDNNNWFAAYGFWLFKYYGHADVRLMNGGRSKWLAEDDKPLTADVVAFAKSDYKITAINADLRAKVPQVLEAIATRNSNLIDVRSTDEFTGKIIAPPGMTETAQRAGHVPGAKSVPWAQTVNQDGTFKSVDDLRALYKTAGLIEGKPTIAYCRIGERSSHTWFVLKYLLGVQDCKNYDGSWTEYGNLIGAPIERS